MAIRMKEMPEALSAVSSASPESRPKAKRHAISVAIGKVKMSTWGRRHPKYSTTKLKGASDSEIMRATPISVSTEKNSMVKAPKPKKNGLKSSLRI